MQSKIKIIILLVFIVLITYQTVLGDGISSQDLIEQAKTYDNQSITYEGEVIGDIMNRGEYAWINVHDGSNALGVWIESSELKKIAYAGSYKYAGDLVRIMGNFNRACPEHGGDLDIHAESIEIVKQGLRKLNQVSPTRIVLSIAMPICAFILFIMNKRKKSEN